MRANLAWYNLRTLNEIVAELVQANFQRVYFTNHDEWKSASPSGVEIISGDVWESIIRQTL